MAIIVPAILEDTPQKFSETYARILRLNDIKRLHVDFCDGKFVPRTSLSIDQLPALDPQWHLEAHIMHEQPRDFEKLRDLGFATIIIHVESYPDGESLREALQNIMLLGMKPAVALNPETTADQLAALDVVIGQVTTLAVHPGHQGNPFLPPVLDKLKALKREFPDVILEIDGGMNKRTAAEAVAGGADLVVVGSDLLTAADMQAEYNQLTAIAQGAELAD